MAKRTRTNPVQFYLNDDEQFILDAKFKASKMKSKSAFLRKLVLFGFVYDVDYSYLRNYNTELVRISKSLNQIAKRINSTNHIYQEDMDEFFFLPMSALPMLLFHYSQFLGKTSKYHHIHKLSIYLILVEFVPLL